ncbi:unnamed protein product [Pedinophyceae sp. YPF-701]|nr:unnamed protein product [Pedinophyceae sp. YPF-701]
MSDSAPKASSEAEFKVYDSVAEYEKLGRIGEGTYGVVYKARHRPTGRIVALKRVRMDREKDGVPVTALREIRVLQACRHPNVVALERVVTGSSAGSVFLVFEFCEHDLGRLIDARRKLFTLSEVKGLLQQLLHAVEFLHDRWTVHRDIKLSNLLMTNQGVLKLCDFGLARYFRAYKEPYTPGVVTLWYRAPEILLGEEVYTEAVDVWAVGCVLAELLTGEPLFPGQTEAEVIEMLVSLLGAPTRKIWPGVERLPHFSKFHMRTQPYSHLRKHFPQLSEAGIDLLNALLTYDPAGRITAREALRHPFFAEHPLPKAAHAMPTFPATQRTGAEKKARREDDARGGDGGKRRKV